MDQANTQKTTNELSKTVIDLQFARGMWKGQKYGKELWKDIEAVHLQYK